MKSLSPHCLVDVKSLSGNTHIVVDYHGIQLYVCSWPAICERGGETV